MSITWLFWVYFSKDVFNADTTHFTQIVWIIQKLCTILIELSGDNLRILIKFNLSSTWKLNLSFYLFLFSFSLLEPNGSIRLVRYTADKNGFHAVVSHQPSVGVVQNYVPVVINAVGPAHRSTQIIYGWRRIFCSDHSFMFLYWLALLWNMF